jgi:hypothetical protein
MIFLYDSEEVNVNQSEEQLQQHFEVVNRIASSMENLASAATGVLKRALPETKKH